MRDLGGEATMVRRIGGIVGLALGVGFACAATASAADFDGSKALLCAATDIVSCHGAGDCGRMSAEEAAFPRFLLVDFAAGKLSGKLAGGEERTVELGQVSKLETALVAQGLGADGKRAFSLRIGQDGALSAGIADEGGAFVILGACTPR
jgi:hypothetical protein